MRTRRVVSLLALSVALIGVGQPAAARESVALLFASPGDSADRRPIVTGVPIYPEKARDERRTGAVVVCFRIRRDGRVVRPLIQRSTDRIFNRAALRAARETRYAEALPGAANATTSDCMTFRFTLESLLPDGDRPDSDDA